MFSVWGHRGACYFGGGGAHKEVFSLFILFHSKHEFCENTGGPAGTGILWSAPPPPPGIYMYAPDTPTHTDQHNKIMGGLFWCITVTSLPHIMYVLVSCPYRQNVKIILLPCRAIFRVSPENDIQGGPEKNGTEYFPRYVDTLTNISVWDNLSWEKWYQDEQDWISSLFSRAHFVKQCRGLKFSHSSLN